MKILKSLPRYNSENKALLADSTNRSDNYGSPSSKTQQHGLGVANPFRCIRSLSIESSRHHHHLPKSQSNKIQLHTHIWKSAIDNNTKQRYYYNRYTGEVTWNKPSSPFEWRSYIDPSSQKRYYYNTLTNETTWEIPIEDDIGDERSYVKSSKQIDVSETSREQISRLNLPTYLTKWNSTDASKSCDNEPWKVLYDNATGKHVFYNFQSNTMTMTKPTGFKEWISVASKSTDDSYFYNLLTGESKWSHPDFKNEPSCHDISKDHGYENENQQKLARLVSPYCQGQQRNKEKMIHKFKGREHIAIRSIESLLEKDEEPYDEQQSGVCTFIQTNLTSSGSEPYDEHLCRFRPSPHTSPSSNIQLTNPNEKKDRITTSPTLIPSESFNHMQLSSHLTKPIYFTGASGRTILLLPR